MCLIQIGRWVACPLHLKSAISARHAIGLGIYKSVKIGSLTVQTNPDADDTSDMIKLNDISYSVEGGLCLKMPLQPFLQGIRWAWLDAMTGKQRCFD